MDIARYSIERSTSSWLFLFILLFGGIVALNQLGRLEDPEFTIKQAMVVTPYPGASATQVEEEVTVRLENALQQLPYIRHITSTSMPGMSQIQVEMKDIYRADDLAQIWDELRRKMHDVSPNLPPGAGPIQVNDDFADVYGVMVALHGEGYTLPALYDHAKFLRRELSLVPGVAKVIIDGVQQEQVSVEVSRARLANLGIPPQQIYELLRTQNTVSNAGRVQLGDDAVRFYTTGEFSDVEALESLIISNPGQEAQLYLGDVANIHREVQPVPRHLVRINGKPALWLGVSFTTEVNVVEVGERLQSRLDELVEATPVGMEMTSIYNQPQEVNNSVSGFLWNLLQAVVIVVLSLFLTMGKRSGFLIGFVLFLTVMGTFIFMDIFHIQLHRVSLGALIIALGMLVDNAIVVTEGMLVGVQRGKSRLQAAQEVLKQNQWPLLGATLIAIIAFAPIGLSSDATGEFAGSLFWVLLISLGLSWVTALTLIPFLGNKLFAKGVQVQESDNALYDKPVFKAYQKLLSAALKWRVVTMAAMTALLVLSVYGFGQVKQSFFPSSNTPIFFASVWYPQGTDIRATANDLSRAENYLLDIPEVVSVATTIGRGAPRFTLPYLVEKSHENYGQLIIEVNDKNNLPNVIAQTRDYLATHHPQVRARLNQMEIGPPVKAAIEVRFSGPEPQVLRELAQQAENILQQDTSIATLWHNWLEPSKVLRPQFNETHARRVGVTKEDVDDLLLANFHGRRVGVYRDGTDLLPIVVRAPEEERLFIEQWQDILVHSPTLNRYIPLTQVVDDIPLQWEESLIQRRDRKRTLTVMADPDPLSEETPAVIQARVRDAIEAINLPNGYKMEWGGEHEASTNAKAALFSSLPLGYLAMFVITVLLFSSARKALVIWTTVPLSIIGVTAGLLLTQQAFSFMALLGMLSLTGMLIKNGIVLLEQVKAEEDEGKQGYQALIDASVKRVRPVSMAAVTTILGMIPLLFDAFFASMAVAIMFGLGFATILTLIVVPVMYSFMLRIGHATKATD
ncbi:MULTISPECIES: efflux RND transporter permease subunit [Gammaproteobacteria]|uniref:efflux RND transporter permease subunit n=1 Tax=Gammaproteobacteria TaxID=1236 RepID=UPI000DCF8951|nr:MULTISPECIES: efflux RND transporter permease subunit [Gammaproteobacteria]RTE86272.1 efflux RND transporter permease subunit [Aliidiomarina sp. B3213]TCZ91623.1 efflux RND transporter permease subunit [Lysobacter sp. N42]